jgi:hypothetical protein
LRPEWKYEVGRRMVTCLSPVLLAVMMTMPPTRGATGSLLLHCKPQQIGLVKSNTLSSQCLDLSSACKNA